MKKTVNIKILSLGDGLKTGSYEFYAGFKTVDNYVNAHGDLISLSENHKFLAANAIIVSRFLPGQIRHVEIFDNQIMFNNSSVSIDEAIKYCSRLDFKKCSRNDAVQKVNNFINLNKHYFPYNSLLQLLANTPSLNDLHDTISNDIIQEYSCFSKALWLNYKQAYLFFENDFFDAIRLFKGKGYGLTPSGDDFIAGVVYGIHFLEKIEGIELQKVKQKVFKIASGKNLFSNNMLNMALNAQYFKRLKDFLSALFYPEHPTTKEAFQQLVSIGNTSGADLLAGLFCAILRYNILD